MQEPRFSPLMGRAGASPRLRNQGSTGCKLQATQRLLDRANRLIFTWLVNKWKQTPGQEDWVCLESNRSVVGTLVADSFRLHDESPSTECSLRKVCSVVQRQFAAGAQHRGPIKTKGSLINKSRRFLGQWCLPVPCRSENKTTIAQGLKKGI